MKDKISRTVIENRSSTYAMISRVAVDRDKLPDPIRGGFLPRLDDDDDDDDVARKNYATARRVAPGVTFDRTLIVFPSFASLIIAVY